MKRKWGSGSVAEERGAHVPRLPRSLGHTRLGRYGTRDEAEKVLAAALRQLAEGPDLRQTVEAWGRTWLEAEERSDTQGDATRWGRYVEGSDLGRLPIEIVDAHDVRMWVASLRGPRGPLAASTRRNALSLLRTALEAACDAGVIITNPARDVAVRARGEQPDIRGRMTAAELAEFVEHARAKLVIRLRSRILTLAYTGLRPSEAHALRWSDLDLGDTPTLRVRRAVKRDGEIGPTKSRRSVRTIPLLPPAAEVLREWRRYIQTKKGARYQSERGLVWTMRGHADRPHLQGFDGGWGPAYDLCSFQRPGLTLYSLRGTCGSLLLTEEWVRAGWLRAPLTMAEVSRWLGHSSVSVTSRHYARTLDEELAGKVDAGHERPTLGPHDFGGPENPPVFLEPSIGLEPTTCGLRNRCSTN
mgnify:CR=1 FL=1